MLKRLLLENFMAHSRTELEFGPGITVLMGANNTGKSAVVEALRCLTANPIPKHYIRHGANQARVELEFDDGHRVAWIRKKGYALYEIHTPGQNEPQVYAKFGRTPPEDVLALLRLGNVHVEGADDRGIDVHIGNQREPIFLLNRPGTLMADFFAASSESAYLLSMQKALKTKSNTQTKELAALDTRLDTIRQRLDRLAPLPFLTLATEHAKTLHDAIADLERNRPRLEQVCTELRDLLARQVLLARALTALEPLAAPPALTDSGRLAVMTTRLQELRRAHRLQSCRNRALATLATAPSLFPSTKLALLHSNRSALALARDTARQTSEMLASLRRPPALTNTAMLKRCYTGLLGYRRALATQNRRLEALHGLHAPAPLHAAPALEKCLATLRNLRAQQTRLQQCSTALSTLTVAPPLSDPARLESTLAGIKRLLAARHKAQEKVRQTEQTLAAMANTVAARLTEAGVCPLCGASLSVESFLGQECSHG